MGSLLAAYDIGMFAAEMGFLLPCLWPATAGGCAIGGFSEGIDSVRRVYWKCCWEVRSLGFAGILCCSRYIGILSCSSDDVSGGSAGHRIEIGDVA